ncbi:hypothetical protein BDV26DRAFT_252568 [Aspergillus bertholletiae]|uniref:Uncharacterized protein n=1 Tax=Aspergillus bertholletiae TaxID=1226010 RepID=A0A5N7BM08_9EURO|nr:hypothetical protein BDV26DRAFT_252568 [Aspergillus bertholletiae]
MRSTGYSLLHPERFTYATLRRTVGRVKDSILRWEFCALALRPLMEYLLFYLDLCPLVRGSSLAHCCGVSLVNLLHLCFLAQATVMLAT